MSEPLSSSDRDVDGDWPSIRYRFSHGSQMISHASVKKEVMMKQHEADDRPSSPQGELSLGTRCKQEPTPQANQPLTGRPRQCDAGVTTSADLRQAHAQVQLPDVDKAIHEDSPAPATLADRYRRVRSTSEALCDGLEVEDFVVQSMPDVSPLRWHLAHTTWFYETFLLEPFAHVTTSNHDAFQYLFNSYYNQVGEQFPRSRRGLVTRPTVREVFEYRREVDQAMQRWLDENGAALPSACRHVLEVGLNHEQQHQELMLTDLKHVFSCNPLYPTYRPMDASGENGALHSRAPDSMAWSEFAGGVRDVGHAGNGFAFDNESPRHEFLLMPYRFTSRLVTAGEFLEFIDDGGYQKPELWLSLGWHRLQEEGWHAPLYWERRQGEWFQFTLQGLLPVKEQQPVCHVSYFEADAFARWKGCRLPTEFEWEVAANAVVEELQGRERLSNFRSADGCRAACCPDDGNFVEQENWHPVEAGRLARHRELRQAKLPEQMFGDVWEWTSSPYIGYPGYRPPAGAIGEYNGKFMCNQFVLRGGSCATSADHIRTTYRNFFPPEARWQFSGIRLAQDAS